VAAAAYLAVAGREEPIGRVVLLGPAHRSPLPVIAASNAEAFATPLGLVRTDTVTRDELVGAGLALIDDALHAEEHSLEVHLPFIQVTLGDVTVLPLLVGRAPVSAVVSVLQQVWSGPATLVVISTDLSHYHDYDTARELDRQTAQVIIEGCADDLGPSSACGFYPLRGLLTFAAARALRIEMLCLANSGDADGSRDRVVGYGSFAVA